MSLRGGARINSGPPPDPNALRRERPADIAGWTILPAAGRTGRVPKWPLAPDLRMATLLDQAETKREMLSAQMEADMAPRNAVAQMAKLDQAIALLKAQIKQSTKLETELWKELWKTPQAAEWSRLLWTREVALYCRWQSQAELGDFDAAREARAWSDRLGLNSAAMLRLRWKIGVPASAESGARRRTSSRSSRERLTVIDGGGT